MRFRSRFDYSAEPGTVNTLPSVTIQSDAPACSVEYALKRYQATGLLGDPARVAEATYFDTTELQSYEASCNLLAKAQQAFEALPAEVRRQYQDSVDVYMQSRLAEVVKPVEKAEQAEQVKQSPNEAVA